ncbi:MAG: endonuclease/exonuclease/phosphatase family protein [Burkholderiales bacterium]|nr:endonuclease/exonuclease/phosphatase family protein [Burkholderiales bacterium]
MSAPVADEGKRRPGWRAQLARRARVLAVASLVGLCLPWAGAALPVTWDGKLPWLIDLAAHWQWLYAAVLAAAIALGTAHSPRWLLLMPALALPWLSAAPILQSAADGAPTFTVMSANVEFDNQDATALIDWSNREKPDLIVVLEVNERYASRLARLEAYPHQRIVARDNPFGIALLSRHALKHVSVVSDSIGLPHIEAEVDWNGQRVVVLAVHPMPPLSAHFAAERNAKLRAWSAKLAAAGAPGLIIGDLNATPWSSAFRGLDAARIRRTTTLQPTWPAALKGVMGIPIDHVLASSDWVRVASSLGPDLGADHRPVVVRLRPAR